MNIGPTTNTRTKQVLKIMHVVAWIAFVGFMIEAGAILTSYVVSCFNPVAAKNLYMGLDLSALEQSNFLQYSLSVLTTLAILCMKAYASYLLIRVLSKVSLENPFTPGIARRLERISYVLLTTAVIAVLHNAYADELLYYTKIVEKKMVTEEFFFISGLIFIISQIFKRGVELQTSNDLTV